jgi:hypothetical protein
MELERFFYNINCIWCLNSEDSQFFDNYSSKLYAYQRLAYFQIILAQTSQRFELKYLFLICISRNSTFTLLLRNNKVILPYICICHKAFPLEYRWLTPWFVHICLMMKLRIGRLKITLLAECQIHWIYWTYYSSESRYPSAYPEEYPYFSCITTRLDSYYREHLYSLIII